MRPSNPVIESASSSQPHYPKGFKARRGLNWGIVGLMYTSFYMCRYNLPISNLSISQEFGFSKGDMGWIITVNMWAYACGQIINGLLADKLGGRRAMLIGAVGTIVMNLAFGAASFWGLLGLFVVLRGIDGYMQSFGSPGMIKINVTWFNKRERGQFAGIYGFMINLGRFVIFRIGPSLLAGFTFLGMWQVPAMHWRWLFWVPSGIAAIVAVVLYFVVKNTPEEAGYHIDDLKEPETLTPGGAVKAEPTILDVLVKIASNPVIWVVAIAYSCTGAVRQSLDHWYPRFLQETYQVKLDDSLFQWLAFLIPFVASAGSLSSGIISDKLFNGARAPVASGIYFIETVIILAAAQVTGLNTVAVFIVLIALTANSTHSLMGVAAAMDIGGKKMAGFAAGVIDAFQYFGGSVAGVVLGQLLDGKGWVFSVYKYFYNLLIGHMPDAHMGWGVYFYFMAPFGMTGCILIYLAGKLSKRRGVIL